jgi:hypothetical protein
MVRSVRARCVRPFSVLVLSLLLTDSVVIAQQKTPPRPAPQDRTRRRQRKMMTAGATATIAMIATIATIATGASSTA